MSQYEELNQVQNRLVTLTGKVSSVPESTWNDAARQLNLPDQERELGDLVELYQSSLKIRDFYFQASSDSVTAAVSRGISMAGRYWGFQDMSAAAAIAGLDNEVLRHGAILKAIEDAANVQAVGPPFVERPLPGGDPLEVGRAEQGEDVRRAISTWWPYLLAVVVTLYLLRRYL